MINPSKSWKSEALARLKILYAEDVSLLTCGTLYARNSVSEPPRVFQSSTQTDAQRLLQNVKSCDDTYKEKWSRHKPSTNNALQPPCRLGLHSRGSYHVDAFAESLRKYPSQYIHHVLKESQSKHERRHTKSFGDVLNSKCQRPYRYDDMIMDTNEDVYCNRHRRRYSFGSVEESCSRQKELINYTYDYLKSESLVPKVDVRYFTELRKAIRSGFKSVVDKKFVPCPVSKSRFVHHKVHGSCSNTSPSDLLVYGVNTHSECPNITKRKFCFCRQPSICDCPRKRKVLLKSSCPKVNAAKDSTDLEYKKIQDEIRKWLQHIPKSKDDELKEGAIIINLAKSLKGLQKNSNFSIKARPEIVQFLNALPIRTPNESTDKATYIEGLVDSLLNRLKNSAESDFSEGISEEVYKFLSGSKIPTEGKERIVKTLVNKLTPMALERPTDDKIYKELLKKKAILILKNIKLSNDKNKDQIIDNLAEKIANRVCHTRLYTSMSSKNNFNNNNVRKIFSDWFENIPELRDKGLHQCPSLIHSLTQKYQLYMSQNLKSGDIEKKLYDDIERDLDSVTDKYNITLSSNHKNEYIKKLLMLLMNLDTTTKNKDEVSNDLFNAVSEGISNIPELTDKNVNIENEDIKSLANSLKGTQTKDDGPTTKSELKSIISDWLTRFLKEIGIHLGPKNYENLINKLVCNLNNLSEPKKITSKQRKRWSSEYISAREPEPNQPTFTDIKQLVDTYFSKFNSKVQEATKSKIAKEIYKNIAIKNILWDNVYENIISIINKETALDPRDSNKLCNEIIFQLKSIYRPKENVPFTMSTQQNEEIQDKKDKSLSTDSRSSFKCMNKDRISQSEHRENVPKVGPTYIKECNTNEKDFENQLSHDTIEHDISRSKIQREFLGPIDKLPNVDNTKMCLEEYHGKRSSVLENINAISEIAINRKLENLNTFMKSDIKSKFQTKQIDNIDTVPFDDDFTTSTPKEISKEENLTPNKVLSMQRNYTDKKNKISQRRDVDNIKKSIYNWLTNMGIGLSKSEINNFTENIVSDITDRQKYLELSGKSTTEKDEIEQLKYQIYRRLRALVSSKKLTTCMEKVMDLYDILKSTTELYPKQNISQTKQTTLHNEDIVDNEMVDKLRSWLNNISSQLYLTRDKNYQENMFKELSNKLNSLRREGNYEADAEITITSWLPKVANIKNKSELNDLVQSLKTCVEHSSTYITQIPTQSSSEFLIENLRGAIYDWLQDVLPFPRNVMANRQAMENFASFLARDIKKVFENSSNVSSKNFESMLTQEIVKAFENLSPHGDKDSDFYRNVAKDLITHIKQQRLFHSISDRIFNDTEYSDELLTEEAIKEAVVFWSKNLALRSDKSYEDIEKITLTLILSLSKYINKDIKSLEHCMRDDILKIIKLIPLEIHKTWNDNLQENVNSLINSIKEHIKLYKSKLNHENPNVVSPDENVCSIINNWCDNLPVYMEDFATDKEKIKETRQNIAKQVTDIVNKLNKSVDLTKKNAYDLIRDEIKELFKTANINSELERCIDILIEVLIQKLRDENCISVKESATSTYQILLHETINKTLSLIDRSTIGDQVSFNALQEKLADAFIELHYPIMDFDIRIKFKDNLIDAIDKFCKQFLRHNATEPINSEQVKDELDKALKNIPIPTGNDLQENKNKAPVLKDASTQYRLNKSAPTSINDEDVDELSKIQIKSNILIENVKTIRKDVSTSPLPIDASTQTEIKLKEGFAQVSFDSSVEPNLEVSPQVDVKEYYWDSSGSNQSVWASSLKEFSPNKEPKTTSNIDPITENKENKENNATDSSVHSQIFEGTRNKEISQIRDTIKDIKDASQQTSNSVTRVTILPPETHTKESENELEHDNDEDKIEIYPSSKRTKVQSDVIHSKRMRNPYSCDTCFGSKRRKTISDICKKHSEDKLGNKDISKHRKENQTCCSCGDYLLLKCKSKTNVFYHQSKLSHRESDYCFCPYPTNFFFKKDL